MAWTTRKPCTVAEDDMLHCGDNVAVAAIAALLLGPFGMFYSTRTGAIVMIVLTVLVALPTLGFGVLLTLPLCVLWAVLAAMRNASGSALQHA
ncbi:hypothetical protein [Rhodovulum euryhalinum]|uniref:Uncharacterized protein n=1 Tax=Rhodovulum euryhalinum TaxID=35805 RepID=A0A4R2KRE1_9RHOB|nr:hypothetical protein [Rhodovulum euryhalinum]TCO73546.1 hypothetical protein EV655_102311 [Rhodovulum euryhalinum]